MEPDGRRQSPAAGGGGRGLGALGSQEIHPPPGRSAAAAPDHFRGAGEWAGPAGNNFLPAGGGQGRGGVGSRGRRTMAGRARGAGARPRPCLSGGPAPALGARPGEVTSRGAGRGRGPRRGSRISASAPRRPCAPSGDQEGLRGRRERGAAILPRGSPSPGRRAGKRSWRRGSRRAGAARDLTANCWPPRTGLRRSLGSLAEATRASYRPARPVSGAAPRAPGPVL